MRFFVIINNNNKVHKQCNIGGDNRCNVVEDAKDNPILQKRQIRCNIMREVTTIATL